MYFRELYKYEIKKILMRKLVWITFVLCLIGITFVPVASLLGTYYVDGKAVDTHYHMFQVDQAYDKALSGRTIDQALLEEMTAGYGQIPPGTERYTLTEEYEDYARPYSDISNLVWQWTGDNPYLSGWEPDEEMLYEARREMVEEDWKASFLTEREQAFWSEKEEKLTKPFIYYYHDGLEFLLNALLTVGILMFVFTTVSLSGVFAEEHARRTDQLILSSVRGKTTIYWAKLCAGATVAFFGALLMTAITVGMTSAVYGLEGGQTAIQLLMDTYSYPLTMGQTCLLAYSILLLTSVVVSLLVMLLSESLHSSLAALAVSMGVIIMGMMFRIPAQYRTAGQIWDYFPTNFLSIWNLLDVRPISIGRYCFLSWQAVPVFYVVLGLLAAAAGRRIFQNYQVSGR